MQLRPRERAPPGSARRRRGSEAAGFRSCGILLANDTNKGRATARAGAFRDMPRRRRGSERQDSAPAESCSRDQEKDAVADRAAAGAFRDLPRRRRGSERQDSAPAESCSRDQEKDAVATARAGAFRDLPRRRRGSEPQDSAPAESCSRTRERCSCDRASGRLQGSAPPQAGSRAADSVLGILLADQRNAPSRSRLRPAHPIDLRRSDCRAGVPSTFGAPCSVHSET